MDSFNETGLKPEIIAAITDMGFEKPTPIQAKSIPQLLSSDRDIIALAQTGTGKTAAFGLPLLQQIDTSRKEIQTLILAPTRELVQQIQKQLFKFTKYCDDRIFSEGRVVHVPHSARVRGRHGHYDRALV